MSILIRAPRSDLHAAAVKWALDRRGRSCAIWDLSDFPSEMFLSTRLSKNADSSSRSRGQSGTSLSLSDFGTVWNRRGSQFAHVPDLSHGDLRYADAESRLYLASLYQLSSVSAVWVNDPVSQWLSGHKLHQLEMAGQCGMSIPETLATNDPDEARAFVREMGPDVVFKPFEIGMWGGADRRSSKHVSYATRISVSDLEDDLSVVASPGIYQECIDKVFDVRVLVAGQSFLAAAISPDGYAQHGVDWRAAPTASAERIEIGEDIFEKTLHLMSELGLLTGSVDFVVDREGNFHFLEVNEGGQFLFLEEMSEELPTLRFFSSFLSAPDCDFQWDEAHDDGQELSLREFFASREHAEFRRELQLINRPIGRPVLQD